MNVDIAMSNTSLLQTLPDTLVGVPRGLAIRIKVTISWPRPREKATNKHVFGSFLGCYQQCVQNLGSTVEVIASQQYHAQIHATANTWVIV